MSNTRTLTEHSKQKNSTFESRTDGRTDGHAPPSLQDFGEKEKAIYAGALAVLARRHSDADPAQNAGADPARRCARVEDAW